MTVRTAAVTVSVSRFGERHQAVVNHGEHTLSLVVRGDARTAVILAVEAAAHDIAHELVHDARPGARSR